LDDPRPIAYQEEVDLAAAAAIVEPATQFDGLSDVLSKRRDPNWHRPGHVTSSPTDRKFGQEMESSLRILGMPTAPVLLIFDFDNTLIDSRIDFSDLRTSLIDMLMAAGPLSAPPEDLRRLPLHALADLGSAISDGLGRAMWSAIEAYEAEGLKGAAAMPHAQAVLKTLSDRGVRLALLTNNARRATETFLDALGLSCYLDAIVTRDDVPRMKPDPAGVRAILDRVGPVRAAYLVGDSWLDGRAAEAAGIRFIGFGPRREEVEARGIVPWAWITDLRELLTIDWDA
jgi:phosphoglycolate phosphatase